MKPSYTGEIMCWRLTNLTSFQHKTSRVYVGFILLNPSVFCLHIFYMKDNAVMSLRQV